MSVVDIGYLASELSWSIVPTVSEEVRSWYLRVAGPNVFSHAHQRRTAGGDALRPAPGALLE